MAWEWDSEGLESDPPQNFHDKDDGNNNLQKGKSLQSVTLGIDVGGTFTDLACLTEAGDLIVEKTPSTPDTPGEDVVFGIRSLALQLGLAGEHDLVARTSLIFHGSTVATNALLTLSGDDVGLITTAGFRDIVEMRGGIRESTFDNRLENAPALAPRHLRSEVAERVDRGGSAIQTPDHEEVKRIVLNLRSKGATALAVCFKHAYANPQHEIAAVRAVRETWPDVYVTRSTALTNRIRLYDRVSTAVVNSYVGPQTERYIQSLAERLEGLGFAGLLLIMGGNGGVMAPVEGRRFPAKLLLSGPSAGPSAASVSLSSLGHMDGVLIDMGGTSFDVSVLQSGRVLTVAQRDVNRYRVSVPMSDIHTVGAGGGSIAWLDPIGLLRVGPRSAGSVPGPASYGQGGSEPTVTDANILLGYIDPEAVLGGTKRLSKDLARQAVDSKIADPLGIKTEEAALGIYRVATAFMTVAVREMTLGKGIDPRGLPLVVGGGAGGLHGAEIADGLGIAEVILPRYAGVLCALGMAIGNVRYDTNLSLVQALEDIDPVELERSIDAMREELSKKMEATSGNLERVSTRVEIEARYLGQFHELTLRLDERSLRPIDAESVRSAFHGAHRAAYGFHIDESGVEIVNLRLTAEAEFIQQGVALKSDRSFVATGEREILIPQGHTSRADCFKIDDREEAGSVDSIEGPALVDLHTSTVLVPPDWRCRLEPSGDLCMSKAVT